MAGIYGSAKFASFLRDLAAGDDALDIVVFGDSNAGSPNPGGWTQGWMTALDTAGYSMYATQLFPAMSTLTAGVGSWEGYGYQFVAPNTAGDSGTGTVRSGNSVTYSPSQLRDLLTPATTLRPNAQPAWDWSYLPTGTFRTFSNYLYTGISTTGDWNEPGTTLTLRTTYAVQPGGGSFTATVRDITNGSTIATASLQSTAGSYGAADATLNYTQPSAAQLRMGPWYITEATGPVGIVYQSITKNIVGWSVTCAEYYTGATMSQIASDVAGAGSAFWGQFFAALVRRQQASGGSGRVAVWVNGGINGPDNFAAWSGGMDDIIAALSAAWVAAGYAMANLCFVCSVTHPTNSVALAANEAVCAVTRTDAEDWDALGSMQGVCYLNLAEFYTAAQLVTNNWYANNVTEQQHLNASGYAGYAGAFLTSLLTYPATQPDTPRYARDPYVIGGDPDPANPLPPVGVDVTDLETGRKFVRRADGGYTEQMAIGAGQILPIADGGTGASTASGARTALGLGTMAVQNASAVDIQGGSVRTDYAGLSTINVGGQASMFIACADATLSTNRTLSVTLGDAARSLTFGGNLATSGGSITLTATGTTNVTLPTSGTLATTDGNVATATALQNARTINGTSFDGTANITLTPIGEAAPLEGVYMMPWGCGGGIQYITSTLTANVTYLRLYAISKPCTLKTVAWAKDASAGTPCAGKNAKVLVYSCGSDGWPAALLHTSTATALSDSSGGTTVTVNLAVTGNVWVGVVLDSTITYTAVTSECKYYSLGNVVYGGYLSVLAGGTQRTPCVSYTSGSYASPDTNLTGDTKTHVANQSAFCCFVEFSA